MERTIEGVFDTSALVPVFYGDHVHHQASLRRFIAFDPSTGCCGAHSLAEVYSALTRMPGKHRISGEQAMLFVGSIRERLSLVVLDGEEYSQALRTAARSELLAGEFMMRCWRIARPKPKRRRSIAGICGIMRSAALRLPGVCRPLSRLLKKPALYQGTTFSRAVTA